MIKAEEAKEITAKIQAEKELKRVSAIEDRLKSDLYNYIYHLIRERADQGLTDLIYVIASINTNESAKYRFITVDLSHIGYSVEIDSDRSSVSVKISWQ